MKIQAGDDAEKIEAVRAEMRAGGRPATLLMQLGGDTFFTVNLTNEIMRNWEDRLCALELEARR